MTRALWVSTGCLLCWLAVGGTIQAVSLASTEDGAVLDANAELSVCFDGEGMDITSRTLSGALVAKRLRCDGRVADLLPGTPRTTGHRVDIARTAGRQGVREWYASGSLGVEHGFDVDGACDTSLAIDLATPGLLATRDAAGVHLAAPHGQALRHTSLHVVDAEGRVLPSRFEVEDHLVRLHADTRGAAWPVTVDPALWSETQVLRQPTVDASANDFFGYVVAIDGDTAVIGVHKGDVEGSIRSVNRVLDDRASV